MKFIQQEYDKKREKVLTVKDYLDNLLEVTFE